MQSGFSIPVASRSFYSKPYRTNLRSVSQINKNLSKIDESTADVGVLSNNSNTKEIQENSEQLYEEFKRKRNEFRKSIKSDSDSVEFIVKQVEFEMSTGMNLNLSYVTHNYGEYCRNNTPCVDLSKFDQFEQLKEVASFDSQLNSALLSNLLSNQQKLCSRYTRLIQKLILLEQKLNSAILSQSSHNDLKSTLQQHSNIRNKLQLFIINKENVRPNEQQIFELLKNAKTVLQIFKKTDGNLFDKEEVLKVLEFLK
ncbi:Hypothetical_protein [Hexamita inflata]|uniref:Hypothetical_protein n=1 Tax=Hexamita inflata TaxID=28002 RepID=A0AA86Q536_9EUKA|nr:Hypothetical protein HINF_LOCUS33594 [Hexamita inflata]